MAYNKHRNIKVTTEDGTFDSKREYARWCDLRILERAAQIWDLKHHVKYYITINGQKVCYYEADFVYSEDGKTVVEDVKGYTKGTAYQMFRLKAKLMRAVHGIEIREVR